jgi:hypothetical protein
MCVGMMGKWFVVEYPRLEQYTIGIGRNKVYYATTDIDRSIQLRV